MYSVFVVSQVQSVTLAGSHRCAERGWHASLTGTGLCAQVSADSVFASFGRLRLRRQLLTDPFEKETLFISGRVVITVFTRQSLVSVPTSVFVRMFSDCGGCGNIWPCHLHRSEVATLQGDLLRVGIKIPARYTCLCAVGSPGLVRLIRGVWTCPISPALAGIRGYGH